jgi:serine/threonine-protein kinase
MQFPGPIGGDLLARRYRLIDRVGAGGMSVVWRARDEVLDRLVAVKWLGTELADDDLYRDLVRREAWATARIKHPAVANVYDYGEVAGRGGQSLAYVVMEMLDGESLSDRLRMGRIPWQEAVAICAQVADALATAHEQGVVHRDISPDNVMLTSSGVRVFDFGIAAPIGEPDDDATGSTFGTPAYVAPERLDGQPAQTATDVYSLGVLLFEMLTGHPPFPEDAWDADAALRDRPAPRLRGVPGLPLAVARLCQRCLAHDPIHRPPAREVAQKLAAYARPWWRGRIVVTAVAAAVAVAAILLALAAWGMPSPPSAPSVAGPSQPVATSVAPNPSASGPATTPAPTTPARTSPAASQSRPATSRPPTTVTTPPPVASIPVEQALDELRATISSFSSTDIAPDVALDLRQHLENDIATPLAANPDADVTTAIEALRKAVTTRYGEVDEHGSRRISTQARDALYAGLDKLKASLA